MKRPSTLFADCPIHDRMRSRASVLVAAALCLYCAATGEIEASVRTVIPHEDPGPPFYARVERAAIHTDIVPHTEEWAAVVFYRSPACVPAGFNLMDLFDPPAAFSCALTIDGFEIWRNGPPPIDQIPRFARFRGLGNVPIWFVAWSELQDAVTDDHLTLAELLSLPSLRMGTASLFHETLRPTGAVANPSLSMTAFGTLDDGTPFHLQHSGTVGGIQTNILLYD